MAVQTEVVNSLQAPPPLRSRGVSLSSHGVKDDLCTSQLDLEATSQVHSRPPTHYVTHTLRMSGFGI